MLGLGAGVIEDGDGKRSMLRKGVWRCRYAGEEELEAEMCLVGDWKQRCAWWELETEKWWGTEV